MPTLQSVVRGIMRDIVDARCMTDAASRDLVESYRSDPILKFLDVPHLTISDLSLTLRFAYASKDMGEVPAGYAAALNKAWVKIVVDEILPATLKTILGTKSDTPGTRQFLSLGAEELSDVPFAETGLRGAEALVTQTAEYVAAARGRLTTRSSVGVPSSEALLAKMRPLALEYARKILADPAYRSDSSDGEPASSAAILVTATELANVPERGVHEIRLSLRFDDIEMIEPGAQLEQK